MVQFKKIALLIIFTTILGCGSRHAIKDQVSEISTDNNTQQTDDIKTINVEKGIVGLNKTTLLNIMAGEIAGQRKNYKLAADHYFQAGLMTTDPAILNRAKQVVQYAGANEQLQQLATHWKSIEPDKIESWLVYLVTNLQQKNSQNINQAIDQIFLIAKDPFFAFEAIIAAISSSQEAQFGYHILLQNLLAQSEDTDLELLFIQSQFAVRLRAYDEAIQLVSKVITHKQIKRSEHSALLVKALLLRAELLLAKENTEKAAVDYMQLLSMEPSNVSVRIRAAELINSLAGYKQAVELLNAGGKNPQLYFVAALYAFDNQDQKILQNKYKALKKAHWEIVDEKYYFLGQIAELMEQFDLANNWYEKVTDEPFLAKAQIRKASMLMDQADYNAAITILKLLQNEADEAIAARAFLIEGEIYRRQKKYSISYDVLTRAITVFPGNYELLYARSLTAEALNLIYITEADLKQILQQNPNDADALNALGYTLITRTDRLEEGGEMIERAYQLRPNQAAIVDSMGWLRYKQGNYAASITLLRQALTIDFNEEIAIHLLKALWAAGYYEQAHEFFDEVQNGKKEKELREFFNVFDRLQDNFN